MLLQIREYLANQYFAIFDQILHFDLISFLKQQNLFFPNHYNCRTHFKIT